jgi:hypothetical protein
MVDTAYLFIFYDFPQDKTKASGVAALGFSCSLRRANPFRLLPPVHRLSIHICKSTLDTCEDRYYTLSTLSIQMYRGFKFYFIFCHVELWLISGFFKKSDCFIWQPLFSLFISTNIDCIKNINSHRLDSRNNMAVYAQRYFNIRVSQTLLDYFGMHIIF